MLPISRVPAGHAWQPFVDRALVGRGDIEHAAILDAEDGAVWASTAEFGPRIYLMPVAQEDGTEEEQLVNEVRPSSLQQLM